jgi:ATP-dependent Lon protease
MGSHLLIRREDIPRELAILPLRYSVFFPGGVLPLAIGRKKTITLMKEAVRDDQLIGVVTQRRAEVEDPRLSDLYGMGTVARVVKVLKMGEENYSIVVQGLTRFQMVEEVQEMPYLKARIEPADDATSDVDAEVEAAGVTLRRLARQVIELMPELPAAAIELVESVTDPGHLADLIAANLDILVEQKQRVLDTVDLKLRLRLVLDVLTDKREILLLAQKLDAAVQARAEATGNAYLQTQLMLALLEQLQQRRPSPSGQAPMELQEVTSATASEIPPCSFCRTVQAEGALVLLSGTACLCDRCLESAMERVVAHRGVSTRPTRT